MQSRSNLKPNKAHKLDLDNNTCNMRALEMTLDIGAYDQGLVMQFFIDFQTYGLTEALLYLKGYEENHEVREGTYAKARIFTDKILAAYYK